MRKNKTLMQIVTDTPDFWGTAEDPTLVLPEGIDGSGLVTELMLKQGMLCPWIQDAAGLINAIKLWSTHRQESWLRILDALTAEYNPIHNYNREELGTEEIAKHRGSKVSTNEDVSETPATMTSTGSVVAYDSDQESETGQSVTSPGETSNRRTAQATSNYTTYEDIDGDTYDKDVHSFTDRITRGNIGVTKTQEMIRDELELRKTYADLEEIIEEQFEAAFLIAVY